MSRWLRSSLFFAVPAFLSLVARAEPLPPMQPESRPERSPSVTEDGDGRFVRLLDTIQRARDLDSSPVIDQVLSHIEFHLERLPDLQESYGESPPPTAEGLGLLVYVVVDGPARVRSGPTIHSDVVAVLPIGNPVFVISRIGNWYRVLTREQVFGFVYEELVVEHDAPRSYEIQLTQYVFGKIQMEKQEALTKSVKELGKLGDTLGRTIRKENREYTQATFQCRDDYETCLNRGYWQLECIPTYLLCEIALLVPG